jgi:hypothetical protein
VVVIRKRKMIREYNSKQVSDEIIRKLIRNAHRAPSVGHTQEFIIVKDPAIKKKLRKVAVDQEYVERAPVPLREGAGAAETETDSAADSGSDAGGTGDVVETGGGDFGGFDGGGFGDF